MGLGKIIRLWRYETIVNVLIVGPAGSGKTLLTSEFGRYLEKNYSVRYMNLDAGVAQIPYEPDFDVRDSYTLEEIMIEEDLGPNGATLEAVDRLETLEIPKFKEDFVLIDTPGQLEPFIFRGGYESFKTLSECCIYLIDSTGPLKTFPSQYLYSLATQYALGIPMVRILSKIDLLDSKDIAELENVAVDPRVLREIENAGMRSQINVDIADYLIELCSPNQLPTVSAKSWDGFEDLITFLLESARTQQEPGSDFPTEKGG